eukprot:gene7098-11261_t
MKLRYFSRDYLQEYEFKVLEDHNKLKPLILISEVDQTELNFLFENRHFEKKNIDIRNVKFGHEPSELDEAEFKKYERKEDEFEFKRTTPELIIATEFDLEIFLEDDMNFIFTLQQIPKEIAEFNFQNTMLMETFDLVPVQNINEKIQDYEKCDEETIQQIEEEKIDFEDLDLTFQNDLNPKNVEVGKIFFSTMEEFEETYQENLPDLKIHSKKCETVVEEFEEEIENDMEFNINLFQLRNMKQLEQKSSLFSEKMMLKKTKVELIELEDSITLLDSSFSIDNFREVPVPFVSEQKQKTFEEIKSMLFFTLNFNEYVTSKLEIHLPSFWYSNEMYKARKMITDSEYRLNSTKQSIYEIIFGFEIIEAESEEYFIDSISPIQTLDINKKNDYNFSNLNMFELEKQQKEYLEEIKMLPSLEDFKKMGKFKKIPETQILSSKQEFFKQKNDLKEIGKIESDTLESFMTIKKIGVKKTKPTQFPSDIVKPPTIPVALYEIDIVRELMSTNSLLTFPKEKRLNITSLLFYNIFRKENNNSIVWVSKDEEELYSEYLFHSYYLRNSLTIGSIFVVEKNLTESINQMSKKDSNGIKLIFCTPNSLDFLLQRCKNIFLNCSFTILSQNFISEENTVNSCRIFDTILSLSKINTKSLILSQVPSLTLNSLNQFIKSIGIKKIICKNRSDSQIASSIRDKERFIDLKDTPIQFFVEKLTKYSTELFHDLQKLDSFWKKFKTYSHIPHSKLLEKMKDLNKERKRSKDDPKLNFSSEEFQKSFTLYFLIEIFNNVINVGISQTFELLKSEKFQKIIKISNKIASSVTNELNGLKKLVLSKKMEDFSSLRILMEFLTSVSTKKANIILVVRDTITISKLVSLSKKNIKLYVMKYLDEISCYSYGDDPKKYSFAELTKNSETNLFVYQYQEKMINLDFKGVEYFIEFETPKDQQYINLGNIHELIACHQIKDYSFRSSLTSEQSNFDEYNDKWIKKIQEKTNISSSVIDSKEISKIHQTEIFDETDYQTLSKFIFSNENKERKEMKKILATEYVFGNKDLLDSLHKRFSIDVDERSTINTSQPDIILNSTHCIVFYEPEQLDEESKVDILDKFLYLSLQFDECLIIVKFPDQNVEQMETTIDFFSSFTAFMMSSSFKIEIKYSFSDEETSEFINNKLEHLNTHEEFDKYQYIEEFPSDQEVFLSKFPPLNLYVAAQIIQKFDLQTLCKMNKEQLEEALKFVISTKRTEHFYHLLHHEIPSYTIEILPHSSGVESVVTPKKTKFKQTKLNFNSPISNSSGSSNDGGQSRMDKMESYMKSELRKFKETSTSLIEEKSKEKKFQLKFGSERDSNSGSGKRKLDFTHYSSPSKKFKITDSKKQKKIDDYKLSPYHHKESSDNESDIETPVKIQFSFGKKSQLKPKKLFQNSPEDKNIFQNSTEEKKIFQLFETSPCSSREKITPKSNEDSVIKKYKSDSYQSIKTPKKKEISKLWDDEEEQIDSPNMKGLDAYFERHSYQPQKKTPSKQSFETPKKKISPKKPRNLERQSTISKRSVSSKKTTKRKNITTMKPKK